MARGGILSTFLGVLWSYVILAQLINFVKIVWGGLYDSATEGTKQIERNLPFTLIPTFSKNHGVMPMNRIMVDEQNFKAF